MSAPDNDSSLQEQLNQERSRADALAAALAESDKKFRTLTHHSPVGIFLDDAQGKAIFINDKCAELVGVPPEHALEWDWVPLIHPDDQERVVNAWGAAFAEGRPFCQEYRWVHGDGTVVWTLGEIAPVRDAAGVATLYIGTLTDITDRKRAEAEQGKLQSQLLQSQKLEAVGRLAGGVAHDFNNMLSVIIGYAEIVRDEGGLSADTSANVDEILTAAFRSRDITRQLLAFARRQNAAPQVLDLNEVIGSMLKTMHRLIGEDIDLAWVPGPEVWPVRMDPTQIDQIIANLCVNARDAIAGVGNITVETGNAIFDEAYCAEHSGFRPGNFAMLSLSDDGCGMDKHTRENIFEPFFTTKGRHEGTGLGLAMIYGIVKQYEGFINVYSEPGRGTTFKIYLPCCEQEVVAPRVRDLPTDYHGRGETVLLVEDERQILLMGQRMLQRLGYNVLIAPTPSECLRLVAEHEGSLDLLITDVVMPGLNGRALAEKLRAQKPDLKVLYMSGYTSNVIAHRGILEDGVHFLPKPFSMEQLGAQARLALDTS